LKNNWWEQFKGNSSYRALDWLSDSGDRILEGFGRGYVIYRILWMWGWCSNSSESKRKVIAFKVRYK
jgi:hypothetical protein